jgi:hypothetical protein
MNLMEANEWVKHSKKCTSHMITILMYLKEDENKQQC